MINKFNINLLLSSCYAEETRVFDFLLRVVFHPCTFFVCIKFNFNLVSDINEILSFPRKFSYQNVDYVKLTNV